MTKSLKITVQASIQIAQKSKGLMDDNRHHQQGMSPKALCVANQKALCEQEPAAMAWHLLQLLVAVSSGAVQWWALGH